MQQAYLLHSYPYKDSSAMLKLFTEQEGIVSAVAKGLKRQGSRWRAFLHAFTPLCIELSGRTEIKILSQLELMGPRLQLSGTHLVSGLYINEILMYVLPAGVAYPEIYALYARSLQQLEQLDPEPVLREFEYMLLTHLGYMPDLTQDESGNGLDLEAYYWTRPEHMPQRVGAEYARSAEVFTGKELMSVSERCWDQEESLKAGKRLLRAWMRFYCKGQKLKSRELLRPHQNERAVKE